MQAEEKVIARSTELEQDLVASMSPLQTAETAVLKSYAAPFLMVLKSYAGTVQLASAGIGRCNLFTIASPCQGKTKPQR
jgi:hypothetical protein